MFRILILAVALGATSAAFAQAYPDAFNRAELVKWAKIVKDSGAKLD